jgi:beta-glucosidase
VAAADVIILYLGEDRKLSGEAHSLTDISLPNNQISLYRSVKRLGKPCVVLLQNGRPLVLEDILDAEAIVCCWFLGSRASEAIHATLIGENNPSGKLPMSFPINTGQIPVYHDYLPTGRPISDPLHPGEYDSHYLDQPNGPRFKFAHGLSYSCFQVSNLKLDKTAITPADTLKISVELKNEGPYAGKETILVFITDHYARISRPVIELVKSKKVSLKNKETITVCFELTTHDLSYYLADGSKVYDKGDFSVHVGNNLDNLLTEKFKLI